MIKDFNSYLSEVKEVGFVNRVVSSLVYVEGLPGAHPQEVVIFESGSIGEITALTRDSVEVLSFSQTSIRAGERVVRTNETLRAGVGEDLLGVSIDPLGHSIDPTKPVPPMKESRPIDVVPEGIRSRARITRVCDTGVTLVDRMIPLGKGQRQLIVGDQKTGKSRFLLRALLSQVEQGSIGIYALIGKGKLAIRQTEKTIENMGIRKETVIVASSSDEATSMIYITPYVAMTIAEYFRDLGKDVFLVLDDMTVHAKIYRELSLIGKKFPGRDAYPGDIFYAHARLLERSGNFSTPRGESAITCLPVVEAAQGDLTGYISTNLMSMTDGHILFDHLLFAEGRRPAINPFLSVTRVGRQTQSQLDREIAKNLIGFLKEAERLHQFTSFSAELGGHIKKILSKESRIMEYLDQTAYDAIPASVQKYLFGLVWSDIWDDKPREFVRLEIQKVIYAYTADPVLKKRMDEVSSRSVSVEALMMQAKNFYFSLSQPAPKPSRIKAVTYDA